ncbi:unnamed protein product [Fusarium graminearum]|uniref:Chromosome 1, complete genome n=1 Tax=Gibberella zeae (strain ATCC MYA-4620 / CBS 123657 / FGSC 9075 / NRRL 31084 / PH-1) TaxID=229533 RepID=I1S530_GIBZE|nr:hypothetical protein FGSG_11948 [Fusarium graminearum PH-1]EYB21225.1 hypothetical protein FG05_11948 [Fusarium graminearum]ESU06733.1 hypothetical protein FGSG_11948 [Fusarium graminearum PH-1]CAG2003291.1 unnamed protein product [Fusarium graminearum]CEF73548.1 unnamed protein product [Fusarium graminearum]CZS76817.1 unnamed protein product [Fusarium graminearum]|eukprot:XP_011317218.1 hypothetical protein FGSG_11948 [Fusarium graminearum PH-1]
MDLCSSWDIGLMVQFPYSRTRTDTQNHTEEHGKLPSLGATDRPAHPAPTTNSRALDRGPSYLFRISPDTLSYDIGTSSFDSDIPPVLESCRSLILRLFYTSRVLYAERMARNNQQVE